VISGVTRIPFLLVMFGVLGGLGSFGLIGLFIGPVILAVLMAVWREWLEEHAEEPPATPPATVTLIDTSLPSRRRRVRRRPWRGLCSGHRRRRRPPDHPGDQSGQLRGGRRHLPALSRLSAGLGHAPHVYRHAPPGASRRPAPADRGPGGPSPSARSAWTCSSPVWTIATQEYFYVEQLKIARDYDLPVLLHCRRANDPILKQLRRFPGIRGIAHAFSGSRQQADEFLKLGFKLGFGGAFTWSRATRLRALAPNCRSTPSSWKPTARTSRPPGSARAATNPRNWRASPRRWRNYGGSTSAKSPNRPAPTPAPCWLWLESPPQGRLQPGSPKPHFLKPTHAP
jgi:hypothetical protein